MYQRIFDITPYLDDSVFLFGARQTGKSTFLLDTFRDVPSFDLLDYELRSRFSKNPGLLGEILQDSPDGSLVIIDEIQKVPELLDEVHRLMVRKNMRFILCGSSARKLKKSSSNTLGGRAVPLPFYPLVSAEVPDFNLVRAVTNGMIPRHYMVENAANRLKGYVEVYIKEEVVEEALVRDLDAFSRFVEVAAIMDGEILNYENIASDCGVSANTVKQYFQILYDTLIGYEIPAYTKALKRRLLPHRAYIPQTRYGRVRPCFRASCDTGDNSMARVFREKGETFLLEDLYRDRGGCSYRGCQDCDRDKVGQ